MQIFTYARMGAFLLSAACLLHITAAHAAPVAAEVFFKDPDIAEAVLSPSGRKLAITTAKGLTRIGLVIIDLAPGGKRARAAQFSDGDVARVSWVNEDRLLFSVLDYSEGSGRPNGAPGLYAVNADGSKMLQLVLRQNRPFITNASPGQDKTLDWNHTLLRVPLARQGEVIEEVLIAEFSKDERRRLFPRWLNTRTGRTRSADINLPGPTVRLLTDSKGDARVAFTRTEDKQAAYWRAPGQREWQLLYESGLLGRPFSVNSLDDAGSLYVTREEGPEGYSVLTRYDFEHHAPEAIATVTTPGFDFSGSLITEIGTGQALGVRVLVDGETTVWFDDRLKALQAEVDKLLPGRVNRINCRRCGQADMVALVRSFNEQDPGELLLYQAQPAEGQQRWQRVARVREGIDPASMATMQLHRIKARDGRELPVWITALPNSKAVRPAVVFVHGGPWVRGSSYSWHAEAQFLASRGYVVIEPEMRGSSGYGLAHYKAGFKQFGQAMQDDVADALRWAQSKGLASEKACIVGSSYGGYSTLMGLIKDPALYRCGVAWMALTDLDLYLTGSWRVNDDISASGRRYTLPEMVGDAEKDAAMIAANSPVKLADRIKAPLLLAFGEDDLRIPLTHGERLRKAMQAAGNDPEWVTYPGEGHGFGIVKNHVDFAQRMEAFLARHLGP